MALFVTPRLHGRVFRRKVEAQKSNIFVCFQVLDLLALEWLLVPAPPIQLFPGFYRARTSHIRYRTCLLSQRVLINGER